jgi:hypothetical protein
MVLPLFIILVVVVLILFFIFKANFLNTTIPNWTTYFDVIYYINIDYRTDRKEHFLNEMKKMQVPESKLIRIPAVYLKGRGDLGCTKSHIIGMETFLKTDSQHYLIFEDDFEFDCTLDRLNKTFYDFFQSNIDYNVCMLASITTWGGLPESIPTEYPFLRKVVFAHTTSGFMVSRKSVPKLLENFIESSVLLERSYDTEEKSVANQGKYNCDQWWKSLQPNSNWYEFYPLLGKQSGSKSDIIT